MPEHLPNYTYRAEWNPESREYVAYCLEFPGRVGRGFTAHEAVKDMEIAVEEELALIAHGDERPPEPLTDRRLSGKFLIRTTPSLHARLIVEAEEQGVSLNHWVVTRLADRPQSLTLNDLFD